MKSKVYIYGLCNVFYDGYYILGIKEVFGNFEFNISKFPNLKQGTFAVIIENDNGSKKIIIDSTDSNTADKLGIEWCDVYGKVNYKEEFLTKTEAEKIVEIGPSFGIKIWNGFTSARYLALNFLRFKSKVTDKREFVANYWRQYRRFRLKEYLPATSSKNVVFFISSIWKNEILTNKNRALFIECCKSNKDIHFEGGFAARTDGNNLSFDHLVFSKKVSLKIYIQKTKKSAITYNTPAVLSCHGWKLGEFLALGKAIISTPHFNKLPAELIDNKHLIYANGEQEITSAIKKIVADDELKSKLEFNSRMYFDNYLAPKKVIERLINKISK